MVIDLEIGRLGTKALPAISIGIINLEILAIDDSFIGMSAPRS